MNPVGCGYTSSLALSYSLDGTRIAVAATEDLFHDMVIFVLDGILGTEIYEPLRGTRLRWVCLV